MYELMWFFGGAMIYKFLSHMLALTQTSIIFKNAEYNILALLTTVAEDVSYIKALKYKVMKESKVDPEQIKKSKLIDEEFFEVWKESCIHNIHASVPNYITPSFNTWKEGMNVLNNYYRDRKHEKQEK